MREVIPMQSSDTRKLGFLVSGILLGLLVNVLAVGFGADRLLAYGMAVIPVIGSLGLAVFSPGPVRPPLTEEQRRQRMRSIAIALMLFAFCAMFYAASIIRIGDGLKNRALTPPQGAPNAAAPRQ
jgi:hypothetical protein